MLSGFEPESDMKNVNPVQKIIHIAGKGWDIRYTDLKLEKAVQKERLNKKRRREYV